MATGDIIFLIWLVGWLGTSATLIGQHVFKRHEAKMEYLRECARLNRPPSVYTLQNEMDDVSWLDNFATRGEGPYFAGFFMPMLWPLIVLAVVVCWGHDKIYPYLPTIKWPSFDNMKERRRRDKNKKIEAKLRKQVLAMQTRHIPDGAITQTRMSGPSDAAISVSSK